jgi:hypothetical protein
VRGGTRVYEGWVPAFALIARFKLGRGSDPRIPSVETRSHLEAFGAMIRCRLPIAVGCDAQKAEGMKQKMRRKTC